jgi:hypothetical protein
MHWIFPKIKRLAQSRQVAKKNLELLGVKQQTAFSEIVRSFLKSVNDTCNAFFDQWGSKVDEQA